MIEVDDLEPMGFRKVGTIQTNEQQQLFFNQSTAIKSTDPGVYLWIQRNTNGRSLKVVYAGKAGNGINSRMAQHIAGLRFAKSERVERIKSTFGYGNCLEVWFRLSEKIALKSLYPKEISAYSTEEEALITRFAPELNRAKTPSMRTGAREAVQGPLVNTMFDALIFELISINGEQRDLWVNVQTSISETHKAKINEALVLLSQLPQFKNIWPTLDFKIVGRYNPCVIPNQTLLVFGKISKTKFKAGTKVLYVSLEQELIGFSDNLTEQFPQKPDLNKAYSLDTLLSMLSQLPPKKFKQLSPKDQLGSRRSEKAYPEFSRRR